MPETVSLDEFALRLGAAHARALQDQVVDRLAQQAEAAVRRHAVDEGDSAPMAAFAALLELPTARRTAVMLHPAFGYWLKGMRRISGPEAASLRGHFAKHATGLVWAEQLALRCLDRAWVVATDARGGLRCPALGRFVELGADHANQEVRVAPGDGANAVILCRDGLVVEVPPEDMTDSNMDPPPTAEEHGYTLTVSPRLAGGQIEVSTRDPWLRVHLTGTNQRTDGTSFFGSDDGLYTDDPDTGRLGEALDLLGALWPEALEDLAEYTRVIVPLDVGRLEAVEANSWEMRNLAFTVSSRQGAVFIGKAPLDATLEMLLHENAHVKLRQIQALDSLLVDPLDESVRVPVPWRPDPRPMPGILEGLFVFLHVAEFELRHLLANPGAVDPGQVARRVADLGHAVVCLERHARLTQGGVAFLRAMQHWLGTVANRLPAA